MEHLVATVNGGVDRDENCVACCQSLNSLFGRMSLKEKLRILLNQRGQFQCPNGGGGKLPQSQRGVQEPQCRPQDDRLAVIISNLQSRGVSRPRTVKTASSTIKSLFQNRLTDSEIAELLKKLQAAGVITISSTKVSYHLPQSPP